MRGGRETSGQGTRRKKCQIPACSYDAVIERALTNTPKGRSKKDWKFLCTKHARLPENEFRVTFGRGVQ